MTFKESQSLTLEVLFLLNSSSNEDLLSWNPKTMAFEPSPGATEFNNPDDDAFTKILGSHSALSDIKPSTINFSANCWTTRDLAIVSRNDTDFEEWQRLQYIANNLGPSLPQDRAPFFGLIDINEYWRSLLQLPNALAVLNGAV